MTTNHQGTVEWAPYAAAIRSVERAEHLEELLAQDADAATITAACLRSPLYASHFHDGFGTLYTAEYQAAEGIARACDPAAYDLTQLGSRAAAAGNVAIPLVAALTERVARDDERAAEWVHYGATSQDAIDTGFVLQLREALSAWRDDLNALQTSLQTIAARESRTPMVARTWLQHAVPTTFGRKAAGWLSAIDRCRRALAVAESEACVLQFGGAAGTLA